MSIDPNKPRPSALARVLSRLLPGKKPTANGESLYDSLQRRGLIGCIEGDPTDLSTNPKYMEGFGQSGSNTSAH